MVMRLPSPSAHCVCGVALHLIALIIQSGVGKGLHILHSQVGLLMIILDVVGNFSEGTI